MNKIFLTNHRGTEKPVRCGESSAVGGFPTPLALCRGTRPPQWLPVVATGATQRQRKKRCMPTAHLREHILFRIAILLKSVVIKVNLNLIKKYQ